MRVGLKRAAKFVMIEGEASLEPAADVRELLLPGSPFTERPNEWESVIVSEFLEEQIGERRGGFSDHKTRMTATLDQRGGKAKPMSNHRHQRAGKSGADDHDLEMPVAHAPPQTGHSTLAWSCWVRLTMCKRCRLFSRQGGHCENCSKSQVSAKTRPRRRFRTCS